MKIQVHQMKNTLHGRAEYKLTPTNIVRPPNQYITQPRREMDDLTKVTLKLRGRRKRHRRQKHGGKPNSRSKAVRKEVLLQTQRTPNQVGI